MPNPHASLVAVAALYCCWSLQREPVLRADSLYDLHDSADHVKWRLQLSREEFASLEEALDVLVGDETRELVETIEKSPVRVPSARRLASEARVLAPIDGLTYGGLVEAAVDRTRDRRAGLQGALRVEKAAAPESRRQLQSLDVLDTAYITSVVTGERSVDITIRNGSEQTIYELLLDCKLIDTTRRATRERGTCRLDFGGGLAPGMASTATAPVLWESRQRLGWIVEARPIRAYGPSGDALWEVPSDHDRREAGRLAEIESRLTVLDDDLRVLRAGSLASAAVVAR